MAEDQGQRAGHEDDHDHLRANQGQGHGESQGQGEQANPEPGTTPEPPPSAPASPDTHTNAGDAGRGDHDRLDVLERTVSGLVDIVAGLTPKDDRPVKVPWTHRGNGRRDEE